MQGAGKRSAMGAVHSILTLSEVMTFGKGVLPFLAVQWPLPHAHLGPEIVGVWSTLHRNSSSGSLCTLDTSSCRDLSSLLGHSWAQGGWVSAWLLEALRQKC